MWRSRARLRARRPGGRRVESPSRDRSAITSATRRFRGTPVHVRLFPPATPDRSFLTPLLALLPPPRKISQPRRAGRRGARHPVQHDARVLVHRQGRPAGHAALPVRHVRAADPRRVRAVRPTLALEDHPRSDKGDPIFIFQTGSRVRGQIRTSPRRILIAPSRDAARRKKTSSRAEAIGDASRGDRRREGRREGRRESLRDARRFVAPRSPSLRPRIPSRALSRSSDRSSPKTEQNKTKRRRGSSSAICRSLPLHPPDARSTPLFPPLADLGGLAARQRRVEGRRRAPRSSSRERASSRALWLDARRLGGRERSAPGASDGVDFRLDLDAAETASLVRLLAERRRSDPVGRAHRARRRGRRRRRVGDGDGGKRSGGRRTNGSAPTPPRRRGGGAETDRTGLRERGSVAAADDVAEALES